MNALINYLVEANLGLCLFLLLYWIFLRDETDFTLKRAFLLVSIVVSVTFPLFHFSMESQIVPKLGEWVPPSWLPEVIVYADGKPVPIETRINFDAWLLTRAIYGGGVVIGLLIFLSRIWTLVRAIRSAPSQTLDHFTILESPSDDRSSFSFFNFIFIGKSEMLSLEEKALIIDHERIHARRLHSIDVLLTNVMGILFWFNPAIRIYKKIFVHLHEYEADARAVKSHNVNDYCSLLAKVALLSADIRLANHFSNSLTVKRIEMMRKFKSKIKPWKLAALTAAVPLFFFVVACQDQVVNEMTEIARNSSIAMVAPESVVARYEAVKKANPNSTYLLVELNDAAEKQLTEMEQTHGIPKSIELFTPDNAIYKNSILNTGPEKISFNQSAEWENAAKDLRTYAIIEYNEMAQQIAERGKADDDVYTIVDETATPEKGMPAFYQEVAQKMVYPVDARQKGIEGKVFVEFIVQTDGSVLDIKAIKGIGGGCDEAAIMVIKFAEAKWIPGKNKGVAVKQRMVLPITFKLANTPALKGNEKVVLLEEATSDHALDEMVVVGKRKQD